MHDESVHSFGEETSQKKKMKKGHEPAQNSSIHDQFFNSVKTEIPCIPFQKKKKKEKPLIPHFYTSIVPTSASPLFASLSVFSSFKCSFSSAGLLTSCFATCAILLTLLCRCIPGGEVVVAPLCAGSTALSSVCDEEMEGCAGSAGIWDVSRGFAEGEGRRRVAVSAEQDRWRGGWVYL